MPTKSHTVAPPAPVRIYVVTKNGSAQRCTILRRHRGEVYVHYVDTDKRLDEWLPEDALADVDEDDADERENAPPPTPARKRKHSTASVSRSSSPLSIGNDHQANGETRATPELEDDAPDEIVVAEETFDIEHHKQITSQRNFEKVNFGEWQIKTWYFSPYPLSESETDDVSAVPSPASTGPKIPGVGRSTVRSHGRTSDLLAGGLHRPHAPGDRAVLWVCDRCFKYMADGLSWELHMKGCTRKHPPGRKVYQRGAHTIWEVDGSKDKLYCQNLSLFGKLFIDIKTLFFDCDNFLFYILTDADSQRDHVLGYFSKEKVSYDDYNLACIITLPPYQRRGYGMLLIEFSYELSRRAGKVGTPERPLSDLGLRSYLSYWVSTIVRFLRRLLSVVSPEQDKLVFPGHIPEIAQQSQGTSATTRGTPGSSSPFEESSSMIRKRRRIKGWDGEGMQHANRVPLGVVPLALAEDDLFTSMRRIEMVPNADGSATAHVYAKCTLADIARATNLRVDDTAFALHEAGLVQRVRREDEGVGVGEGVGEGEGGDGAEVIVLTREMVEAVAAERKVKRMMMDLSRVLL